MNVLLLVAMGLEETCLKELEKFLVSGKKGKGYVLCDVDVITACLLAYSLHSVSRVLLLLDTISYTSQEDVISKVKEISSEFIKDSFSISTINRDKEKIVSQEVAREYALKIKGEAMYKGAITPLLSYFIDGQCFLGVDVSGFDLSKRDYRIFIGSDSLKGTTAFSMLAAADYSKEKVLVDPFCRSGTIVIEAGLVGINKSPHYYQKEDFAFRKFVENDWEKFFKENISDEAHIYALDGHMKNINAAKKNAKIAGVHKRVHFSRKDLEWLDLKFKKGTVDCIVSVPPQPSKRNADFGRLYADFFNQAKYILNTRGKIILLVNRGSSLLQEKGKQHGFSVEAKTLMQGKEELSLLIFSF